MTEEVIAWRHREGRGQGKGPTYKPWTYITELHSRGRTHEPYSHKTGRQHQLLSDGEWMAFAMLEWARDVSEIQEQKPLDRIITQEQAFDLGVLYQYYKGTHVPLVMTLDLLVTHLRDGKEHQVAYSVKTASDLEDRLVVERLEVERSTCQAMGVPYCLLVKELMPVQKIRNILWIRDAQLDPDATEPYPGFFDEHQARMLQDIVTRRSERRLVDYCEEYDRRYSVEAGTGMRVARMLMQARALTMDLNNPEPQLARLDSFKVSALSGRLRSVGGN